MTTLQVWGEMASTLESDEVKISIKYEAKL